MREDGRSVVGAAFSVLQAVPDAPIVGQISAIAAVTGIPRTTVHRLLRQLAEVGAVSRSDRHWELGTGLLRLAYHVDTEAHLRDVAAPVVQELRAQTGGTVSLVLADQNAFVAVDMVPGRFNLPFVARSGFVMPEGSAAVQALSRPHAQRKVGQAEDDQAVLAGTTCYAVTIPLPDGREAALQIATSPDLPARDLNVSVHRAATVIAMRAVKRRVGFVG